MTPPYGAPRHALHDHPICRASSFLRAPQRQWRTKGRTRQLMPSGLLASAILVANNLRDIPTDSVTGKHTLAVRLGDPATRRLYLAMLAGAALAAAAIAVAHPWCWLSVAAFALAVRPVRLVRGGATGRELIAVLAGTNVLLLGYGVLLAGALALSTR